MQVIRNILVLIAVLATNIGANGCHQSPAPSLEVVARNGTHFEGPHWCHAERALYWVDIVQQEVWRLDFNTGCTTFAKIACGPVTFVITIKNNPMMVLLSVGTGVFVARWDELIKPGGGVSCLSGGALRQYGVLDIGLPDNRCNDAKADEKGRVMIGTMGYQVGDDVVPDQGTLYMMDQCNYKCPRAVLRPVSISNGIAWTHDSRRMFYIDTPTRNIQVFDYDVNTGTIRNRRILFCFQANNVTGSPDGMTIDTNNHLFVACYNGGQVIKIDSCSGELLAQYKIPAAKVTSVMFGGPNLDILFITTSKDGLSPCEQAETPGAGCVFALKGTGSKGRPEYQAGIPGASDY